MTSRTWPHSVFLFQPARADQPSAAYSVSHRDHYVLRLSDTVARISLSVERNANAEHNQQAHKAGKTGDELVYKVRHHVSLLTTFLAQYGAFLIVRNQSRRVGDTVRHTVTCTWNALP